LLQEVLEEGWCSQVSSKTEENQAVFAWEKLPDLHCFCLHIKPTVVDTKQNLYQEALTQLNSLTSQLSYNHPWTICPLLHSRYLPAPGLLHFQFPVSSSPERKLLFILQVQIPAPLWSFLHKLPHTSNSLAPQYPWNISNFFMCPASPHL
jgi:hypothetical protein